MPTIEHLCQPIELDESLRIAAAQKAIEVNPLNAPQAAHLAALGFTPNPNQLALLTRNFWDLPASI